MRSTSAARKEYFGEPQTPRPQAIRPAVFAVVRNQCGQVLLVQRADTAYWELPGGWIEVGESARAALVREVAEEAGIAVEPTAVAGVYSDPGQVIAYSGGPIYQQFAVCFHATALTDQRPQPDNKETAAASWFDPEATNQLSMHRAIRLRLDHALNEPNKTDFD
jgi:8-oxo-dGTP pyrophosphatase MutT (NUDIX family)